MTARGAFSMQSKRWPFDRRDQQSSVITTAPSSDRTLLGSGTTGAQDAPVGTTIKFDAPRYKDLVTKNNETLQIDARHMCITAMREYEAKSLEELRLEDYLATLSLPGSQQAATMFRVTTVTTGGSQQNKPSIVSNSVPKKQDPNWTRKDPNGIFTSDESNDEDQPLEAPVATKNQGSNGAVSSAHPAKAALEQTLKTTDTQLKVRQKEIQELRTRNEQIITTVGKCSTAEHIKLQAQFYQQKQRLTLAERDVEQLKKQLAEANIKAAEAPEQAGSSSELEKLREDHKKYKESFEKARQLALRFRSDKQELGKENEQLKADKKALEEQLEMEAKDAEEAQTELEKLREDHKETKSRARRHASCRFASEATNKKLGQENDQLKADKKTLEEELETATKVAEGAQTEATTMSTELEKLREDHKKYKESFEKARQLAIRFLDEKKELEKEKDQLKADKSALDEQLAMAAKVISKFLATNDVSPTDKLLLIQEHDDLATRFVDKLTLNELHTIVTHEKKEQLSKEVLLKLLNHKYGLMAHHG